MQLDLILENLNGLTMDPSRPRVEAIGILGNRIVAAGAAHELADLRATTRLDLGGATVVPGFNDAHNHMSFFGATLNEVDLTPAAVGSVEEVVEAIAAKADRSTPGTWVVGSRYDHNKLAERRHPTRHELDRVSPDNPVLLQHTSGHFSVVNTAAMRLARIGEVDIPEGGVIPLGADGTPTGLLEEQAQKLAKDLLHPFSEADLVQNLGAASDHYLSEGITSAQEAAVGGLLGSAEPLEVAAYQRARAEGRLRIRVSMMVAVENLHGALHHPDDPEPFTLDLGLHTSFGDDFLRVGPTKIFADGSLMGRTAAMFDDYAGEPGNNGYFQMEEDLLHSLILRAHRSGWQIATHAIGDRAVASVLDAYAEALRLHPRDDHRHRIEHCGVIRDTDVDRMAELGVIPVPQARFISEIGDGMAAALGPERVPTCYRQRSFLDAGLIVPGSSDRPVVAGAPMLGVHDLVNQRTASGAPFNPHEALTVDEALYAYTMGSAIASFDEDVKGSITAGKLADLAVLDRDPTAIAPDTIADTQVLATMVGGRVEYDAVGLA
ncbi:MAG: amidohydrolase [Acidimicrobiales bacterium]